MIRFILGLMLTVSCWGCAIVPYRYDGDIEKASNLLKEKKYTEAVSSYDKIAKDAAGTDRGASALYTAALARTWYENPARDLTAALQKFDEFLKQYPLHEKAREAQNWRYYIRTLVELRKENEHLTRNIEQLKRVDIRHEERRTGK